MGEKRSYHEEHKKKRTGIVPFLLCCAFLIIAITTIKAATGNDTSKKNSSDSNVQTVDEKGVTGKDKPDLYVIKEINETDKTMILLPVDKEEEIELTYTGGTEVYDKYNQVISISQLTLGEVVDANYSTKNAKLTKIQISNQAWEYQGVNKWSIDTDNKIFNIVKSKYRYSKNIVIISQGQLVDILTLNEKDELTVKGNEYQIYSIIVTKGHGTIRFVDYQDFLGGTAYIGNSETLSITPGMSITVQEGSYDVTLENGDLTGIKHAVVGANQKVVVDMGEFKKPPTKTGLIDFTITPKGAELFIDGLLQSYNEAVTLEYGLHSIKVALGGYTTYSGDLEVDKESQSLTIGLVEAQNTTDETTSTDNSGGTLDNTNSSSSVDGQVSGSSNTGQTAEEERDSNDIQTNDENTGNYVSILQPIGASVYFDGSIYKGEVPVSFPKTVGTYHITFIKSGYVTETHTVEFLDDGKDVTLRYDEMTKMQ